MLKDETIINLVDLLKKEGLKVVTFENSDKCFIVENAWGILLHCQMTLGGLSVGSIYKPSKEFGTGTAIAKELSAKDAISLLLVWNNNHVKHDRNNEVVFYENLTDYMENSSYKSLNYYYL